ncbi:hypothetical protein [Micromonospora sp. NPDC049799]|uniref:hypothetical protein n=1 Tax=Micromonospora sp. NPDC049799 TaxID=3154741 RepID=UPI0033CD7402
MRTEVYAHPVSFRTDPAGQAARLAGTGVDRVRLAFAYHSGRWLLSTSAPASVADLDGGLWFAPVPPLRGRLRPAVVADLAGDAATALRAVGIEVSAWLVGLHQSALATAHPDLALRNAFDHRYRHALCPSRAEVVDHAVALVSGASSPILPSS